MTAFVASRRRKAWMLPAIGCVSAVLAAVACPAPGNAQPHSSLREQVTVHLDQAALVPLPDRTATLVIGNPIIADAAVQGGTLVITAKSYGVTNLVALDRAGVTVAEFPLEVVGPVGKLIIVYSGVERETYDCIPKCERRITIGDSPKYLTQNLGALAQFSALAQGGTFSGTGSNPSNHLVSGYTTQNGTSVQPHYQTNPNETQRDNYGTQGNQNPYTGQYGTRQPQH